MVIGLFIFKMWQCKAIPDFVGIIGNALSGTIDTQKIVKTTSENLPKPSIEKTLQVLSETPASPLLIMAGIGLGATGMAVLKILTLVLHKVPK